MLKHPQFPEGARELYLVHAQRITTETSAITEVDFADMWISIP